MKIRQRNAIKKDQDLVECPSAHAYIRLGAISASCTDIHPGQILQYIRDSLNGQSLYFGMGYLLNQPVGFRLNFSFVRNDQHLLKTKLSGF